MTPGKQKKARQPDAAACDAPAVLELTRYGDWERKGCCVDF